MATRTDDVRAGNVSRSQIALVVGLLVVLLGALWFLVLRGGEEQPEPPVTAAPRPVPSPVSPPIPGGRSGKPRRGPVETFEVFAARDPFEPLISDAAEGASGQAPATTTTATDAAPGEATGATTTTTTAGGQSEPGPAAGGGATGGASTVGGHRVRLIDVFSHDGGPRARIQVDSTVYKVDEGERFADSFKLLSASGRCASLLFGDDQFSLCEGEEILK